jgi:hypothetical protein
MRNTFTTLSGCLADREENSLPSTVAPEKILHTLKT